MGVQSIIGRIGDGIQGKYSANSYTGHDNDVTLLVYRIGGPRILHILHTTHDLPRVCYQHSHSHSMDINTVDDIAYHE